MLSSYLTMQNAMMAQNMAQTRMMAASDKMRSSISFGASQPIGGGPDSLDVSFGAVQSDALELQTKADETKVSVFKKIAEAIEKKLGKDIQRSTPKYGGVDIKA